MQARAILEAAVQVAQESGETVVPEIMIPLVGIWKELDILKAVIDRVADEVMKKHGVQLDYMVGTMIELPRAALRAGDIAQTAEFFSFGTNDLTQTTFGISRDDAGSFLPDYQRAGILEHDPFVTLDTEGVGELVRIAAERGRAVRPDLKLGICGEHGGDPASVLFCETVGLGAHPTVCRSPVWLPPRPPCPASGWSGIEPMLPGSDLGTRRKAATVNPQLAPTRHLEVAGQRDDPLVQGREPRRLNHVRRPSRRSARATSCWIRRGSEPSPVAFRSYVRPGHRGSAFWLMPRAAGERATQGSKPKPAGFLEP
jgi:hypothetical protein